MPLSSSIVENEKLARTPIAEVYEQIEADLKTAEGYLSEKYVGKDGVKKGTNRVRPNKATARALLARVYLYMNRFTDAELAATSLIDNTGDYSLVPLKEVFLAASQEVIWQLGAGYPNTSKINTSEGAGFILSNQFLSVSRLSISNRLLQAFEVGDQRKENWVGTFLDSSVAGSKRYYFPYKYKIATGTTQKECSVMLRLAEQYLIRSEARAQLGNLPGAVEDLNMIRARAGLPNLSILGISQATVLAAVLKERQVELFTEQGHRLFDLKRTGHIDAVMTIVCPLKMTTWDAYRKLWPIPATELLNDRKLVQNIGYL
jgi:hypothetical protein